MAVSWSQGLSGDLGDRPVRAAVISQLIDILKAGVEAGELKSSSDVTLIAETLWDCYLRSYRLALYESWDEKKLVERLGRQVELLLAGQAA